MPATSDGAVQALGCQHDTRRWCKGLADERPSATAPGAPSLRPPRAAAKSPLGAFQRPCRESSYELNMWKKNLAFMQRRLSMWLQSAVYLGLENGFESPDFDRPGRLPHQQGPSLM